MPKKATGTATRRTGAKPKRPPKAPSKRAVAAAPAKATSASGIKRLRIKQVRSEIGHPETYRRTLRALGLRYHQQERVVADTPSTRGMLAKLQRLVVVLGEEA